MRFIMMHKADKNSEADIPPSPELMVSMGKLMEEMAKAGVLLAGEGLQPSSKGVRLKFSGGKRTVTRGPLIGSNELIAGLAIVRVESMDKAIEWASRLAKLVGDVEIDIGLLKEPWDLGLCPKPDGQMTRFMIMYKADENSEAGVSPTSEVMEKWTQDMVEAGVLLSAQALQPSSKGARLKFTGGKRTVCDGPFTESKELIGGFCTLQVKLKEEAIEWGSRFAKALRDARVEDDLEIDICPLS
jgi:hypothetical protein